MSADELPSSKPPAAPSRRLAKTVGTIAVLGLMGASYALGRVTIGSNALPEIAATLPGDESEFNRELDERVRQRFPVGSDEESLLYYLRTQNFIPDWRKRDEPNAAYFIHPGIICEQAVRIIWSADASGKLTSIGGDYKSHCI